MSPYIAAGPESYVRIFTDKEETVAGMGQGEGCSEPQGGQEQRT